jgi:uncharacterized Zn finger protein (UPF0148 family)
MPNTYQRELRLVVTMEGHIVCPECGTGLRVGSTFCLKCGHKMEKNAEHSTAESVESDIQPQTETLGEPIEWGELDEQMSEITDPKESDESNDGSYTSTAVEEGIDTLPSLDESELPEITEPQTEVIEPVAEPALSTQDDELSWEADESLISAEPSPTTMEDTVSEVPEDTSMHEETESDLSWDDSPIESEEIKEGMPFVEIEPPRVLTEAPMGETEAALAHLFPEGMDSSTIDAVQHLFPEGRRATGKDFVNRVVGMRHLCPSWILQSVQVAEVLSQVMNSIIPDMSMKPWERHGLRLVMPD